MAILLFATVRDSGEDTDTAVPISAKRCALAAMMGSSVVTNGRITSTFISSQIASISGM